MIAIKPCYLYSSSVLVLFFYYSFSCCNNVKFSFSVCKLTTKKVSWSNKSTAKSHKNATLIMTSRITSIFGEQASIEIVNEASWFYPFCDRSHVNLLTRVIPQEAKDKALQALFGEPSAQAGGGCKDSHDHEGWQHQPDNHTGAQRHCELPTIQSAPDGLGLSFIVCDVGFFLSAVRLEEAKRCAVQEVSREVSVEDWLITVFGIISTRIEYATHSCKIHANTTKLFFIWQISCR